MMHAVQTNIKLTLGRLVPELLGGDGVGAVPVPEQDHHLGLLLIHQDLSLNLVGGGDLELVDTQLTSIRT